jgi:peptide deformylase
VKIIPPKFILKTSDDVKDLKDLMDNSPENVIKKMSKLCKRKNGVALAGPQVGIFKKFFYSSIDLITDYKHDTIYINPWYESVDNKTIEVTEGCLSYNEGKDLYKVNRFTTIKAHFQFINSEDNLEDYTTILIDKNAIIFQHETDHLYGVTIATKGIKLDDTKSS